MNHCRLVGKNGELRVRHAQLLWRNPLYAENAVNLGWTVLIQVTLMAFFLIWLVFGFVYYYAENLNGTLCDDSTVSFKTCNEFPTFPNGTARPNGTEEFDKYRCVTGVYDFPSALLFSVETMTTIGYGARYINERCPIIVFFTLLQSFSGVIVTGILTGLVMTKFEKPSNARRNAVKFSERAVIMRENGELYLAVKVVDQEVKHTLDRVSTDGVLVAPVTTLEGEHIPLHPVPINFGISGGDCSEVPFLWPVTLLHHISETSPFWKWGPEQWSRSDWEILLWISGTSSTGTMASRTSYKTGEVDWGRQFATNSPDLAIEKDHVRVATKLDTLKSKPQDSELPFVSASELRRRGFLVGSKEWASS